MRRHVNARDCLNEYITQMTRRECKNNEKGYCDLGCGHPNMPVCLYWDIKALTGHHHRER